MVAAVPKRCLAGATQETVGATLRHLRDVALEHMKTLRAKKDKAAAAGREHAFFTVQLANATLALETWDPRP